MGGAPVGVTAVGAGPAVQALLIEDLAQQRLPARSLAAALERGGFRTRLVHFCGGQGSAAVVALAVALRPRLVILSLLFANRVPEHLALAAALRGALPGACLALAGPLPTFVWAELLAACPALDAVLRGEAEGAAVLLARSLGRAEGWAAVPGLAYRSPEPRASPLPPPADLDGLPIPLREEIAATRAGYGYATVEASRGCYHRCSFCLPCAFHRAAGGPGYRLRGVESLLGEVEALCRRGAHLFLFDDEQFLPPGRARIERVAALGRGLARRGLRIAFTIKCRAGDVEAGLFRRLQRIGLLRVYVGIEAGCQATLDLLGKGVTAGQNLAALAVLDQLGIVADFRSLLFHPWSTLAAASAEIDFLAQANRHMATCFDYREVEVYPGTPLAARLRAEGRGAGDPWPLAYALADPRAELLRRLGRLVFAPAGAYAGLRERLTQAWFDLLLDRRFNPAMVAAAEARRLKAAAQGMNMAALQVWREMLEFAGTPAIYDADRVNERAAAWAGRVAALALTVPGDAPADSLA